MELITGRKFESLANGKDILYSKIDDVHKLSLPNHPFKLITHNGDLPINDSHRKILDHPFLTKWYGTNVTISHHKLQAIPIGIPNPEWIREEIYRDVKIGKRDQLFYFRWWGDSMVGDYRKSVKRSLESQGFVQEQKKGISEYLTDLTRHLFCPCPNGYGVDTHAMWECIYMDCIPLVERNVNTEYFKDLPIILIDDWNNLPYLSPDLYMEVKGKSMIMADFNYWKKLITE